MSYYGRKGNCRSRVIGAMTSHRIYLELLLDGRALMPAKRPSERQSAERSVLVHWLARSYPNYFRSLEEEAA